MTSEFYMSIRKFVRAVISFILNPLSPVMILLVGWVLTLIVTATNEEFPRPINWCVIHREILFFFLLTWVICAFLYQYASDALKEAHEKNVTLIERLKEKDRLLNTSSGIILNKFGEFGRFKRTAMFEEAMKIIVDNSSMIDSAQLYSYSILNRNEGIVIKLNAVTGYAQEDIVINSILQTYYRLRKEEYEDIKFIIRLWKQLLSGKKDEMSWKQWELKNKIFLQRSTALFSKIKDELRSLSSIKDLFESDGEIYYNNYRMLTVLYQLMNPVDNLNELPISLLVEKDDTKDETDKIQSLENELYKGKRTGVLGSILLEDVFMFRNSGTSSKKGRLYIAFPLEISEQNYCVLFTVGAPQMKFIHSNEQLLTECERLKTKFVSMVQKSVM